MNRESFIQKENIDSKKYLQAGEQTKITPELKEISDGINSLDKNFDQKITDIQSFVLNLKRNTNNKEELFRKRTAGQIVSDGFVTGCTDRALVFIALARSMNIPAKYIDTIDLSYLEGSSDKYMGHVYSAVLKDKENEWIVVDPSIKNGFNVNIEKDRWIIYAEGLDSWDVGIKSIKDVKDKFIELRNCFQNNL